MNEKVSSRKEICFMGVCEISNLYPATLIRRQILKTESSIEYSEIVYDTKISGAQSLFSNKALKKTGLLLKMLIGHIWVVSRYLYHRPKKIYIAYPGIILASLICLKPKRLQPEIYLDSFISIYDTVVHDRALLNKQSVLAKFLWKVERLAMKNSNLVLVDTDENIDYYSKIFDMPKAKFTAIPLSIVEPNKPSRAPISELSLIHI